MTMGDTSKLLGKEFITSDITHDFKDVVIALNRMLAIAAPGYEFLFQKMPERGNSAMGIALIYQSKDGL